MRLIIFIMGLLGVLFTGTSMAYAQRALPEDAMPENVITSFHRRAVDSSLTPWRSVGRVNIGGIVHCSGGLVAENIVLTAAHCLYDQRLKQMVSAGMIHFLAGYAHGEYLAHSRASSYIYGEKFNGALGADRRNLPYDWALVVLREPIGREHGSLSLHKSFIPDEAGHVGLLNSPVVTTAGYPKDRAHILSLEENCSIHKAMGGGIVLLTSCIALHGDSGGPILQKIGEEWMLIGIQTSAIKRGRIHASIGLSALAFRDSFYKLRAEQTELLREDEAGQADE